MNRSHFRERGHPGGEGPTRQTKRASKSRYTRDTGSKPDWTNSVKTSLQDVAWEVGKGVTKSTAKAYVAENQPELLPLLETLIDSEEEYQVEMKKRQKGRKVQSRRGGRRRQGPGNGYLKPERFHFKDIVPWSEMGGTKNRWMYQVKLSSLIQPFVKTYDEFRAINLQVKFLADAPEGGATGCYTGVLMDQKGFGDFGIATGTTWFKSIACFPGSKLLHRGHSMNLSWRPTEPEAREWRRGEKESGYIIATMYFADDGTQESEIGGSMLITGTMLARGRYWNVPTLRAQQLGEQLRGEAALALEEFEHLEVV